MLAAARLIFMLFACVAIPAAGAQAYPDRPMRLVVPFAPGGGNDFLARLTGQKLGDALDQPMVIDNRAGADGTLATALVAKAVPDGYTLLLGFIGPLAIRPSLGKVNYDPARDFAAVGMLATSHHVLAVNPAVAARKARDLIALANANPGRFNFASGGNGSPQHLVAELFKAVTGSDIVHIPYKGSGPAVAAVAAGEAQMVFGSIASLMPYIHGGRLKALAVTSPRRSPLLPEVPTLAETGLRGIHVGSWYALLAPAATPKAALARLNAAVAGMVVTADFRERIAGHGFEPLAGEPGAFQEFLRAETLKWAKVIKTAGIRMD
jgi:tripartite-type tricarboxylate transporter receptor subunit TctC